MTLFRPESEVGVRALHDHLSEYLERVEGGAEFVVTRRGRPVARLSGLGERPLEALARRGLVRMPQGERGRGRCIHSPGVGRKRDIKQFRQACAELRMSAQERQGGALMATAVALDSSPANVLRSMRGSIVDARLGHPDVLHVEIKDSAGERWLLATQDADWSPPDPSDLVGHSIEDAQIDEATGDLVCKLSSGSLLEVKPARKDADDDPPNWELITPGGVLLEFGPGLRW